MKVVSLHQDNPNKRDLNILIGRLKKGDICIFPTDSIYAMGCLMSNKKGIDRIIKISGKKEKHAKLSLICKDIKMASQYTTHLSGPIFKMLKRTLPGPFTFILTSNSALQRMFKGNKKEIGIRIPDNNILMEILELLDEPLISTSLNTEDEIMPYYIDPLEIEEKYKYDVDFLVDGGLGDYVESTVVDCTGGTFEIVREGKGDIDLL